jgi:threonine/homoserine/homoserine lactone efflux protein
MNFLPDTSTLLTYSLACLILFATPGPDMSLFLARTVSGGRKAGFAAMIGALTGCLVHTCLAALGLSALLAASPKAFMAMKIAGALYLLWLAYGALRFGSAFHPDSSNRPPEPFLKTFWIGLGINLTNPKVVLFFVTFLPQFITAQDPHASAKLFFLGVYFVLIAAPLAALMILGAEKVITLLRTHPHILKMLDYAFAGLFGAFALKILLMPG